jgi:anthranilate phosphoribosyltransferase
VLETLTTQLAAAKHLSVEQVRFAVGSLTDEIIAAPAKAEFLIALATKGETPEEILASVRYRVLHHASKSNMDLQITDYCTWAIYRKWNGGDERSFNRVKAAVRSEWDVLQAGTGFPN